MNIFQIELLFCCVNYKIYNVGPFKNIFNKPVNINNELRKVNTELNVSRVFLVQVLHNTLIIMIIFLIKITIHKLVKLLQ